MKRFWLVEKRTGERKRKSKKRSVLERLDGFSRPIKESVMRARSMTVALSFEVPCINEVDSFVLMSLLPSAVPHIPPIKTKNNKT